MTLFRNHILFAFNHQLNDYILTDCPCYESYKPYENFIKNVIDNRTSYSACICYYSSNRRRINHKSVPILFGSFIDFLIRGKKAVEDSLIFWGCFITLGVVKIPVTFSTFDALSMHPRKDKKGTKVEWYLFHKNEGLAIRYQDKLITYTYKKKTSNNLESDKGIDLINSANPFLTNAKHTYKDYSKLWDAILEQPFDMNNLFRRLAINGPTITTKYIKYDIKHRQKKKSTGTYKMSSVFNKGTMYFILTKKCTLDSNYSVKPYPESIDNTVHEGRSGKILHLLALVTRSCNDAIRNSSALAFPKDGLGIYCPLNTKDLKSAGEHNVFCEDVITTEETDQFELYRFIQQKYHKVNNKYIVIISDFLVDLYINWDFETLLDIKNHFPHVTTSLTSRFVIFKVKKSIPIKYCEEHDAWFSSEEINRYPQIKFPEMSYFSSVVRVLYPLGILKAPPSKTTVAMNNVKGSVAVEVNATHTDFTRGSLGPTCFIRMTSSMKEFINNVAVLDRCCDTSFFNFYYETYVKRFEYLSKIEFKNVNKQKLTAAFFKLYNLKNLANVITKKNNMPYKQEVNYNLIPVIQEYSDMIFSEKNSQLPDVWILKLNVAFGNPHGLCIEDGIVLDSKTASYIPEINYKICLTINFTVTTKQKLDQVKFFTINDGTFFSESSDTCIGYVVSASPLYIKNSKHCLIKTGRVGDHFYYVIHFLPKESNMYTNLKVTHVKHEKTLSVVITGEHNARVREGSKLANGHGQKNIISKCMDLSSICGVTRDGRKIHAQLLYNPVSILSRAIAGQIIEGLLSPDLAFTENGSFIAPVSLIIHALHPYPNLKLSNVKADTLTNANGFYPQGLGMTNTALKRTNAFSEIERIFQLHGYAIKYFNKKRYILFFILQFLSILSLILNYRIQINMFVDLYLYIYNLKPYNLNK
ncbi:late expression factor 8 [Gryllus bimaculatus nudivirus]|uniref:DNA-directed RNA polymerase n=1 Tax=Gryllus bimaculatus nudivirus TaxID=432587 RepID=A4L212_9VIRU|nr:late expression factor 8 [Gryllus bimaculatus nudivirus]ABO45382.1 late expression factor 8 [Gryllus bimaculatus nudivirus]